MARDYEKIKAKSGLYQAAKKRPSAALRLPSGGFILSRVRHVAGLFLLDFRS